MVAYSISGEVRSSVTSVIGAVSIYPLCDDQFIIDNHAGAASPAGLGVSLDTEIVDRHRVD